MNVQPTQSKRTFELKHEAPLSSCAFDPTGRFLFAGGRTQEVVWLELASQQKHALQGHTSWVHHLARAGSELVLSADYVGHVLAWDCRGAKPELRWNREAHPSTIYGLSVSADGKTFATGDRDGLVRVWRTDDCQPLAELPRIEFPVYGVALHPDGRRLITADRQPKKPRLKVWDFKTRKELLTIDVDALSGYRNVEDIEWGGIRGVALSLDGKQIIACGRAGYDGQACALVYGVDDGKQQHNLSVALKGGFYYAAKFHPQGFLLTAGGDLGKGEVRAWDVASEQSLAEVALPGPCGAMDIHPDGQQFAAALAMGKGSYPDSGSLVVYQWSA